jgi:hypothetical protein
MMIFIMKNLGIFRVLFNNHELFDSLFKWFSITAFVILHSLY